jgi:hypothetical protein
MKQIKKFDNFLNESNKIIKIDNKNEIDKKSLPIVVNQNILQYMVDYQTIAWKTHRKSLSCTLVLELEEIFGKPNKILKLDRRTKLWILKYKNLTFNVYSANVKGTSIEICGISYESYLELNKLENIIIEFLEELYKKVNKISDIEWEAEKYNL